MHFPKTKPRCKHPGGCVNIALAKGLCELHYHRQYARLKNGSLVETPAGVLPEPHWTFENPEGEASLIAADEKRAREEKNNVAGLCTTR
jgi:hypothetical protein